MLLRGGLAEAQALTLLRVLRRGKWDPQDHRDSQGCPGTPESRYGADGEGELPRNGAGCGAAGVSAACRGLRGAGAAGPDLTARLLLA